MYMLSKYWMIYSGIPHRLIMPALPCQIVKHTYPKQWVGVQVELVVDDMRRSLTRRAGVDRRLPQFVGVSGFQDFAINIVVLVSPCHWHLCNAYQSHGVSMPCPHSNLQKYRVKHRPWLCHDHIMPKIQRRMHLNMLQQGTVT